MRIVLFGILLAFAVGSSLYRLDGSCLFSPDAWRSIEARLLGLAQPTPGAAPSQRLRIECGGRVTETPLEQRAPH